VVEKLQPRHAVRCSNAEARVGGSPGPIATSEGEDRVPTR
jgi:hypothetical protein